MPTLALLAALLSPPPEAPRWTIQIDPLTTLLGFAHVQVERALGDRWSIYAGPSIHFPSGPLAPERQEIFGYGPEVGVRWFWWPGAPEGPWVGVRGLVAFVTSEASGTSEVGVGGYGSTLVGYTWIYKALVLSGGLGVQYIDYEVSGEGYEGVIPAAHTTLGVAF